MIESGRETKLDWIRHSVDVVVQLLLYEAGGNKTIALIGCSNENSSCCC